MKCNNCGAEIDNNLTTCTYCGATISYDMKKEQEQINKQGCPKCGSSNITFNREKQGDYKAQNGTVIVRHTVGVCKDCGYTWNANPTPTKKKSNTWLWVLGWICIFPLPLTILMLRKKDMKKEVKYGIIIAAWILYFIIAMASQNKKNADESNNNDTASQTESTSISNENNVTESKDTQTTTNKDSSQNDVNNTTESSIDSEESADIIDLVAGELGEYGQKITLNENTDFPDTNYCYFIPAGTYTIKNIGDNPTQVDITKNEKKADKDADGNTIEYWAEVNPCLIKENESAEVTIDEGYFIEIEEPAHITLTPVL